MTKQAGGDAPRTTPEPALPRNAAAWAKKVDRLSVDDDMRRFGYTVTGRRVTGPQQGFGRLWQRTYWTDLGDSVTPQALIREWRAHFGDYWPRNATFHGALTGIEPGAVAPLEVGVGHGPSITTGVLVLYADEESFTFMTPEGHMFAGMITFSAEAGDAGTRAQIRILIRPNDPIFELGWPIAKRGEDTFWSQTLRNVAAAHGVPAAVVHEQTECLDRKRLWRNWRNVRHNAAIRSGLHAMASPFRSG